LGAMPSSTGGHPAEFRSGMRPRRSSARCAIAALSATRWPAGGTPARTWAGGWGYGSSISCVGSWKCARVRAPLSGPI